MRWLCIALTAGLLMVGLWPFSFFPRNQVGWLPDRDGLKFRPAGIAYDPELLPVPAREPAAGSPGAYTIELWLKPGFLPGTDVFHILTIDDGRKISNLVLCQWLTNLELRVRADDVRRGYNEVGGEGRLLPQTEQFLTVTADTNEIIYYAEGRPVDRFPRSMLPSGGLNGRVILGDAAEGKHPWRGQLFGLAIFHRALAAAEVARDFSLWTNHQAANLAGVRDLSALYLFDERHGTWAGDRSPNRHRMLIPAHYQVLRKQVLTPPWEDFQFDFSELRDDVVNVSGFLPYGFCVFLFRRMNFKESSRNSFWITVVVGGGVSLLIELIQVWLPDRYSSSTDWLFNVLGTGLGALIARRIFAPRLDDTPGSSTLPGTSD
jgi:VanZ family protein